MRYSIAVLVVVVLGGGVFLATNELLLESAEPPTVDEVVETLEGDRLSGRFAGEVAGLTIMPREGEEYAYDTHCSSPQWDEHRSVDRSYTTGTDIDIPPISGFDAVGHRIATCDGRVAFNSVRFKSPSGDASIDVVRVLADPVLHKDIPASRVTEVDVSGHPAVHVRPVGLDGGLVDLGSEQIYIVEDFGITTILFEGPGDILDIAEQVLGGAR